MTGVQTCALPISTKEGNKSIAELKRESATKRLQNATLEASRIVSKAQDDVKPIEEHKRALQGEIEGLQRDLLTVQQVKDIPHTKTLIGDKQVVATEDLNALCRTAATAEALMKEIVLARKINARAQELIQRAKDEAAAIISEAEKESLQVKIQRARRESELENKLIRAEDRLQATLSLLSDPAKKELEVEIGRASCRERV